MPQAEYVVEQIDGQWKVRMGEKLFGYSSMDAAVAAAVGAARKAEAQGFEAVVTVCEGRAEDAA